MSLGSRCFRKLKQLAPVNADGLAHIEKSSSGDFAETIRLERQMRHAAPKLSGSSLATHRLLEIIEQVQCAQIVSPASSCSDDRSRTLSG